MASLINLTEGPRSVDADVAYGVQSDWLRVPTGQDRDALESVLEAAWDRVESRICARFIQRPLTVIVRADTCNELIELPIAPVTITTAEKFDPATGIYTVSALPTLGPTSNSMVLRDAGIYRLSGSAGPDTPEKPPAAILKAVDLLVSHFYENRGDVGHDHLSLGIMNGTGAGDLLRPYARI